jgi:signal transduction histidine kinase
LILNIAFVLLIIAVLISIFLKYNNSKDKEISEITKYIEEINRKNYTLHIDEISEDELSILKNEIYKTTIMLKENAENSLTDKKNLKKSLEDISHQLKTPLTSILIMLDNLIDDTNMDSNMREEFIRDIKKEVTNINFLVQSILKLSKFDSNTISFSKEKIYLKEIVEEAVKKLSSLCDLRNINIEISGDNKAQITGDFMWQVEAISNIVKNCVEHSNSNEKIIINYEQNNIYSSISIQDFGEGILKEDLPHIFERFYKGKNSTEGGIGIGLALAKTIIEEGNGSIDVKTSKNGTKFIIKYFKV